MMDVHSVKKPVHYARVKMFRIANDYPSHFHNHFKIFAVPRFVVVAVVIILFLIYILFFVFSFALFLLLLVYFVVVLVLFFLSLLYFYRIFFT